MTHPDVLPSDAPRVGAAIPTARQQENRRKAVERRVRETGCTRQEAEAHYDAATGPCGCGATKPRNAKYCAACAKEKATVRSAEWMAEHRALEQMRDRIRHRMRKGATLEEAQAMELVRGVCECGKPSRRKNGRICDDCHKQRDREVHAGKPRLFDKFCANCNAPFRGSSRAKYCERHTRGVVSGKTRGYAGKKPKAVLPANWDKPIAPAKREKQAPTVEVIINHGVEITRIPSMFADWRATSPDEYDPAKARAVAEILRRR